MKKNFLAAALLMSGVAFVSCLQTTVVSSSEEPGAVKGVEAGQDFYCDCYSADELVNTIINADPEFREVFPAVPSLSDGNLNQIQITYVDDRTDEVDPEGVPCGDVVVETGVYSVPDGYEVLRAPATERPGWDFVGWEMVSSDYDVNAKVEFLKYLRAYKTKLDKKNGNPTEGGYTEQQLIEYLQQDLGLTGKSIDFSSLGTRIFEPGETIKNYFENVIIRFFASSHYDTAKKKYEDFPWNLTLRAVWKYSDKSVNVEYHDYIYDMNSWPTRSGKMSYEEEDDFGNTIVKEMPHRTMYSGTKYYGMLTKVKPVRTGYVFSGWTDGFKEFDYSKILADYTAFDNAVKEAIKNNADARDIRYSDVSDNAAEFAAYFDEKYSDGAVCELYPIWKVSGDFFEPSALRFVANGSSGFDQDFTSLPTLVSPVTNMDSNGDIEFGSIETKSFAIATQDVSGGQLKKLLQANENNKWGFSGLDYKEAFTVADTDDFWYDNGTAFLVEEIDDEGKKYYVDIRKNQIAISGIVLDYENDTISGRDDGSGDYPIVFLTLPQAMVICNLYTAAYNKCQTNDDDKLTFAYAQGVDTTDAKAEGVIHTVSQAINHIKEKAIGKTLARENATGFRLPTAYEYQMATSMIHRSDDSEFLGNNKSNLLNEGYPAYVKDTSLFGEYFGLDGSCYINQSSMSKVNDDRYKNPLGMFHGVGNVRKWLDTAVKNVGDKLSTDSGKTLVDTVTLIIGVPSVDFDYAKYSNNKAAYNVADWFPGINSDLIKVSLTKYSWNAKKDRSDITFEFSLNRKDGDVGQIKSDLVVPVDVLKGAKKSVTVRNAVNMLVVASLSEYMVRSGSFMQSDSAEGYVHKYFDLSHDLRRSSAPWNYAFYDLGMRLVRSI